MRTIFAVLFTIINLSIICSPLALFLLLVNRWFKDSLLIRRIYIGVFIIRLIIPYIIITPIGLFEAREIVSVKSDYWHFMPGVSSYFIPYNLGRVLAGIWLFGVLVMFILGMVRMLTRDTAIKSIFLKILELLIFSLYWMNPIILLLYKRWNSKKNEKLDICIDIQPCTQKRQIAKLFICTCVFLALFLATALFRNTTDTWENTVLLTVDEKLVHKKSDNNTVPNLTVCTEKTTYSSSEDYINVFIKNMSDDDYLLEYSAIEITEKSGEVNPDTNRPKNIFASGRSVAVFSGSTKAVVLDVNHLQPGLYSVRVPLHKSKEEPVIYTCEFEIVTAPTANNDSSSLAEFIEKVSYGARVSCKCAVADSSEEVCLSYLASGSKNGFDYFTVSANAESAGAQEKIYSFIIESDGNIYLSNYTDYSGASEDDADVYMVGKADGSMKPYLSSIIDRYKEQSLIHKVYNDNLSFCVSMYENSGESGTAQFFILSDKDGKSVSFVPSGFAAQDVRAWTSVHWTDNSCFEIKGLIRDGEAARYVVFKYDADRAAADNLLWTDYYMSGE